MIFDELEAITLRFKTREVLTEFKDRLYKLANNREEIRLIDVFDLANVSPDRFDEKIAMTYGWERMDILCRAVSYHTIQPEGYVMVLPGTKILSDNTDRKGEII